MQPTTTSLRCTFGISRHGRDACQHTQFPALPKPTHHTPGTCLWPFSCADWAENYCLYFLYAKRKCAFTATGLQRLVYHIWRRPKDKKTAHRTCSRQLKLKEVPKSVMLALLDRYLPKTNNHVSKHDYYPSIEAQSIFFKVVTTMIKLSDGSIILQYSWVYYVCYIARIFLNSSAFKIYYFFCLFFYLLPWAVTLFFTIGLETSITSLHQNSSPPLLPQKAQ